MRLARCVSLAALTMLQITAATTMLSGTASVSTIAIRRALMVAYGKGGVASPVVRAFRSGCTSPDSGGLSITRHPIHSSGRSAASESRSGSRQKGATPRRVAFLRDTRPVTMRGCTAAFRNRGVMPEQTKQRPQDLSQGDYQCVKLAILLAARRP